MARAPFIFSDYRGLVQLKLETAEDLAQIHALPAARWSSTSVPIDQLLCDEALLRYVDIDGNGRIRVQELLAAHDWLRARLRNTSRIAERTDTVHLDDLDPSQPDAARLRALAKKRIKASGQAARPGATLSLADIRAFRDGYARKSPNGDGIVAPTQIEDAALARLAALIIEATGGVMDLSGEVGVSVAKLDAFLALGHAALAWEAAGALRTGAETSLVLPFGEATAAAFEVVDGLAGKLDQFFAQCDLLGQGPVAEDRLAVKPERLAALDVNDPAAIRGYLREAALGPPDRSGVLDLESGVNSLFADEARRLSVEVLPRALGEPGPVQKLDRKGWERVRALFEPYRAWQSKKPASLPGGLAGAELRALLEGPLPAALRALVNEDEKASAELVGLSDLEKLALLQRWILDLANNMVSFPALFSAGGRCLFEVGTLVLDGREINLCVRVLDKAEHRPIAETSNIFVAYVELSRKEGDERKTMHVAAGVTSGSRRGIAVGKRGVFYDRDGKEWDAKVTDVIVKPISIQEAALAPFVKLRDFVGDKMTKLFGTKLEAMEKSVSDRVDAQLTPPKSPPAAPPPPPVAPVAPPLVAPGAQGSIVGGGIAFAAVGSAAAFALQTLSNTNPLNALLAVAGVALGVMTVSGFLGWLKLRKRDVSALLEASGWAFNVRIYLRRNLSLRFTRVPPLPRGSVRELRVLPVFVSGEDRPPVGRIVLVLAAVALGVSLAWHYHGMIVAWLRHFFPI
ncbi:hypothetical protein [Polyangium jinanense]|uniref:EF-hand domain-containing protein n=1 Tax=Polyangium jinanense TaxID=2829994 RepID=A0A9X3X4D2_9BACT|nr:hypothetical protein [Polyangium jinanense]MDC3955094.1 hypothetical protein [Polyangium jinanense]MDC3981136.1 hypothetical protein [Polyangium jinanense]